MPEASFRLKSRALRETQQNNKQKRKKERKHKEKNHLNWSTSGSVDPFSSLAGGHLQELIGREGKGGHKPAGLSPFTHTSAHTERAFPRQQEQPWLLLLWNNDHCTHRSLSFTGKQELCFFLAELGPQLYLLTALSTLISISEGML